MRRAYLPVALSLALISSIVLCGCGGGGGGGSDFVGTWSLLLNFVNAELEIKDMDGEVEGVDGALKGTLTWTGASAGATGDGQMGGTYTADRMGVVITFPNGYEVTIVATVNGDTMTGTAVDSNGQTQNITATRNGGGGGGGGGVNDAGFVGQITGTWTATVTDPTYGSFPANGTFTMTLNANDTFTMAMLDVDGAAWVTITDGTVTSQNNTFAMVRGTGYDPEFVGNIDLMGNVQKDGGQLEGSCTFTSTGGWRGITSTGRWSAN
jgi:hypothetical protein